MKMIACVLLVFAAGVAGEQDALVMDDACLAGQGGEECALALRQLRGEQHVQEVARHSHEAGITSNEDKSAIDEPPSTATLPPLFDDFPVDDTSAPADEDDSEKASTPTAAPADTATPEEEEEYTGGFCCYSGASAKNVCGTCYPTAKASEGTFCNSKSNCGGCGGTWCTAQCVFSGSDPANVCGTAYDTAIASAGDYCSKTETGCKSCKGTWCFTGEKGEAIPKEDEDDSKKASTPTAIPWDEDGGKEPPSTATLPPLDSIPDDGTGATADEDSSAKASTPTAAPADTATPKEDVDDINMPPSAPTLPPSLDSFPGDGTGATADAEGSAKASTPTAAPADAASPKEDVDDINTPPSAPTLPPALGVA